MKDHDLCIDLLINEIKKKENLNNRNTDQRLYLEIPQDIFVKKEKVKDVEPKRVIIIDI